MASTPTTPSQPHSTPTKLPDPRSENARRLLWNEWMKSVTPHVQHDKVAVLLLSWEESYDDLGTADEVTELAQVFGNDYGFHVVKQTLKVHDKNRPPRVQMKWYLAQFVHEHNGEGSLLIVYYAGHGWCKPDTKHSGGNLMLSGSTTEAARRQDFNHQNSIDWHSAEEILVGLDADVFVIFDCCAAGEVCRPRSPSHSLGKCFECFAACPPRAFSKPPGPHSFTRALIWSLRELYREPCFSTSELLHKVSEAPGFPQNQTPMLFPRIKPSHCSISISRQRKGNDDAEVLANALGGYQKESSSGDEQQLHLRFVSHRVFDDNETKKIAGALKHLMHTHLLSLQRIEYVKAGKFSRWDRLFSLLQMRAPHVAVIPSDSGTSKGPGDANTFQPRVSTNDAMERTIPGQVGTLGSAIPNEETALVQPGRGNARFSMPRGTRYHVQQAFKCIWDDLCAGLGRATKWLWSVPAAKV